MSVGKGNSDQSGGGEWTNPQHPNFVKQPPPPPQPQPSGNSGGSGGSGNGCSVILFIIGASMMTLMIFGLPCVF